jgi:hypothetical protein
MQFDKSFNSANKTVLAILTATVLVGSQFPAQAQTTPNSSSLTFCLPFIGCFTIGGNPNPGPGGGGTGPVRPVPIPALGIGLAALGMGLARKRRQLVSQNTELPVDSISSVQK